MSGVDVKRVLASPGLTFAALSGIVGVLSLIAVALPPESSLDRGEGPTTARTILVDDEGSEGLVIAGEDAGAAGIESPTASAARGRQQQAGGKASASSPTERAGLQCRAGQNGGATDVGVTATEIRLASTVVQSGVGASFLGDSPKAMQAVVQRVNREGGICGRILKLSKLVDDGWDAKLGLGFLKNFIASKEYFALPVVPSSEGLTAAIEAKEIESGKIPVIGSDGMLRQQYQDDWVWPVATATESTMRIMAKHAYDLGARTFGIVYDQQYRFGREGAEAFKKYVESLPGATLAAYVPVMPGQSSYGSEVERFNGGCRSCDMTAMLLEPTTAETWVAGRPNRGKLVTSGAQTLFNRRFAQNCRVACHDMLVWTGYNPPIDALANKPGIAQYVADLRAIDPGVDVTNAFVEGAYLGMNVFVEALRRVGPDLTRERLKQELDAMRFESDLSSPLLWAPGKHNANIRAQAFSMQYAGDGFSGFRNEQTGWIADPRFAG